MSKPIRFPVPPGVIGNVIKAASDPDVGIPELANLIKKDAVLTAHILKTINSSLYSLRSKVAQVDRAVAYMGIRTVRNIVLSLGIKDLFPAKSLGGFPIDKFWESSLRRGAASSFVARALGMPMVDELFTQGLTQDIGILVTIQKNDEANRSLTEALHLPADRRLEVEKGVVKKTHDVLGAEMLAEWQLPEELFIPIRFQHDWEQAPDDYRRRAQIAHVAEVIADMMLVEDKQAGMDAARTALQDIGVGSERLADCVSEVSDLVAEFAELFGFNVADQPSYQDIIAMASDGLVKAALSYEQMTQRLETALDEQRLAAERLQSLTTQLEAQAKTDGLTGLPNRRAFDQALTQAVAMSQRKAEPMSILMIDVDHFKRFNDTYGHQAGDLVLQKVADAIRKVVRVSDTPARYGGEEFSIILPFTDRTGGEICAERLRSGIADLVVPWEGRELRVTASLGGVTLDGTERGDPAVGERAVTRADLALYRSKEDGRNCVTWSDD